MSSNTVELIGDEVLAAKIIDRSITEIIDDTAKNVGLDAFAGCASLTHLECIAATSIASGAFARCTSMTMVNLPAVTVIGANAFQGCTMLTTADFPAATTITTKAFQSCTLLTTANFPVATNVGSYAFSGCIALTTANFPVATTVSDYAFSGCKALKALILSGKTMCTAASGVLNNSGISSGTGYIYVPAALVDTYKAATNWSTYANQFRALEDYTVDGTTTGELDPTKI